MTRHESKDWRLSSLVASNHICKFSNFVSPFTVTSSYEGSFHVHYFSWYLLVVTTSTHQDFTEMFYNLISAKSNETNKWSDAKSVKCTQDWVRGWRSVTLKSMRISESGNIPKNNQKVSKDWLKQNRYGKQSSQAEDSVSPAGSDN